MDALTHTQFVFPQLTRKYEGKVRDVYTIADQYLVMIATDRISAFDVVLPMGIPYKGQVLNQIASLFLDATADIVPNWKIAAPDPMVTVGHCCAPFPVEMIVRGYLCGSAWRAYKAGARTICHVPIPDGMVENQAFDTPIITPTTKAEQGAHDQDISREEIIGQGLVSEEDYTLLEQYALALFQRGTERAADRGLILVDTKYEFGKKGERIYLIDEIHTPDSSRYFYKEGYSERLHAGEPQRQLSKEFVREWLMENGFSGQPSQTVPEMTPDIVTSISERYIELYGHITGLPFTKFPYDDALLARIEHNTLNMLARLIWINWHMRRFFISTLLILCFALSAKAQTPRYYIEHRVRWMENIYTIAKKYKADPNVILEYNGITANLVRRGLILRIPVVSEEIPPIEPIDNVALSDSLNLLKQKELHYYDCLGYQSSPHTEHRVSLILPFQSDETGPNNPFLEFYNGLLMAILDLKEEGMTLHLSSYDSGRLSGLPALVQSGALRDPEIVIGPVFAQDLFAVANYMEGQNVKIISPLDRQTEEAAWSNPNFFQVNPSLYNQQANLIQCLPDHSGTVYLFYDESGADQELVQITKDILVENHIFYREFIHKIAKDQDITGQLAQMLTPNQNNHIIVASTDEAFVSDLLRSLYLVHSRRNCPVTLYGNAQWRVFENVDLINYYHNMNLHLSVTNYVDYQNIEVKRFLARYRALFLAEPSNYAYHGYDVGYYFLRALYTHGPTFEYCIEQGVIPATPLQSNFRFQKVGPSGGFINTGTRIIRYLPDFRIEILR